MFSIINYFDLDFSSAIQTQISFYPSYSIVCSGCVVLLENETLHPAFVAPNKFFPGPGFSSIQLDNGVFSELHRKGVLIGGLDSTRELHMN